MPGYVCPPLSGCEVNPNQAMGSLGGAGTGTDRHPILGEKKGGDPSLEHRSRLPSGYQDPIGLPRPYRATKTLWQSGTLRMGQEGQSQSGHFFWGVVGKLDACLGEDEQQRLKAVGSGDVSVSARNGIAAAG